MCQEELLERSKRFYPNSQKIIKAWSQEDWERFQKRIFYRGGVRTKEGQAMILPELIERERRRGLARSGVYRKRVRSFVDGLLLGVEEVVREELLRCRTVKFYLRRVNPIPLPVGGIFELREQRRHARVI